MRELIVRGALLDMDGTLVDSNALVEELWAEFALRHALDVGRILAISHGRPSLETIRRMLPHLDPAAQRAERDRIEAAGLERTDGVVEVPGAAAFLARAEAAGLPCALVTSAPADLATRRFAAAGVPQPERRVTVDDVAHGKPHPEPFERGAALLGLPAHEFAGFEDSGPGLASVRAAGAQPVVVGGFAGPEAAGAPRLRHWDALTIAPLADGRFRLRIA